MKKLLLSLALIISFSVTAQNRHCATSTKMAELLNNPEAIARHQQVMDYIQNPNNLQSKNGNNTTIVVTIPVVVHVLYKNATQNVSDAQIASQIAVLNKDYRKLNTDFSTVVPTVFQPFGADIEINFVMAKRTPANVATTGIERKSVASSFSFDNNYYKSQGLPAWDTTQYLNIWVGKFTDTSLLGFAYLPSDAAGQPFDGLCIGYDCFGTTGTAAAPFNKGRTATHEIGHYFGLLHPWGDDNSVCGTTANSDGVADTPATNNPYSDCPAFPSNLNACTNTTNGSMFMNYMDYVNDACMAFFTAGQKVVMQNALNGPRASLLTSLGGVELGLEDYDIAKSITVFPNPTSQYFTVNSNRTTIDKLEIYNNIGQVVKTEKLQQTDNKINVQELPTGIYYLKIYNEGKFLKTERLIKQ